MKSRLQKILAEAGYGSRRSCEELIRQGRVELNGRTAGLGAKADPEVDRILVDGAALKQPELLRYIMLHKPPGVLTTVSAPDSRPTVRSLIDLPGRLYPVGRLDMDSEGLVLMTNDGELTAHLTHPRYQHEKEYRVLIEGPVHDGELKTWRQGLTLEDGTLLSPVQVWIEEADPGGIWLGVILKEGKKRQIRRMAAVTGFKLQRLIRTRIASLKLGELAQGKWRYLDEDEIQNLKFSVSKKG
jgi:23S rRNA pseudouridine2605 synthase